MSRPQKPFFNSASFKLVTRAQKTRSQIYNLCECETTETGRFFCVNVEALHSQQEPDKSFGSLSQKHDGSPLWYIHVCVCQDLLSHQLVQLPHY